MTGKADGVQVRGLFRVTHKLTPMLGRSSVTWQPRKSFLKAATPHWVPHTGCLSSSRRRCFVSVFSVLLFCLWDRVIFEQCCQPFSASSSYSFSCIIVSLVLRGQEYLTENVRKEWYIFTHGSRLQLAMVRKSWWQEQDVSSHIPSVARKQRAGHGVLSSLSTFYVFQDLKPCHGTTHNQGGSPYFE